MNYFVCYFSTESAGSDGTESSESSTTIIEASTHVALAEEFDSHMRHCILFRYCRPIESDWLKHHTTSLQTQHWALVAHFPQSNRTLLFEANENMDTCLMEAFVSHSLWTENNTIYKEELVKVVTSPKRYKYPN